VEQDKSSNTFYLDETAKKQKTTNNFVINNDLINLSSDVRFGI